MAEGSSKPREIDLGDDFGDVFVRANGMNVQIHADGRVETYPKIITKSGPANDTAKIKTTPEIGDEMEDGTVLAGYYEGKPLYARPRDESGTYTFNEAAEHAKNIGDGFHVPTKNELNVLYENRNKGKLAGTFNVTGSDPAGWYWSSTPSNYYYAWAQRFSDGYRHDIDYRTNDSSLRLVR